MNNGIWKYVAISAISGLIGLLSGQFIPNRSIVTSDQLNSIVAPLNSQLAAQSVQITELTKEVANLNGQLRGVQRFDRDTSK